MDETTVVEASQRIEELKVETVEAIVAFVREAAGFAAQEVPLLVREVLNFGLVDNGVWWALWLLIFGAALWLFVTSLKWAAVGEKERSCSCDARVAAVIASGIATIVSGSLMLVYAVDTLQVIIAPRMYLLKMLASL